MISVASSIFLLAYLLSFISVCYTQNGLFPLFTPFFPQQQPQQRQAELPHKPIVGRTPNEKLKACCATLDKADAQCKQQFCDFRSLSSNSALVFLTTCAPRGPTVGQMWDCASSRADHTHCCRIKKVQPACMAYCETTNGVPTNYVKYLTCLSDFDKIRDCFKYHLRDNANLKGQF